MLNKSLAGRAVSELALINLRRCVLPVGGSNPVLAGSQGVKSLTGTPLAESRREDILQGANPDLQSSQWACPLLPHRLPAVVQATAHTPLWK